MRRALYDLDDEATRRRVLHYIASVGGIVTAEAKGGVFAVELPDVPAILDVCTMMGLDSAEYSAELVSVALRNGNAESCLGWVQREIEWRDEPGERLSYPTTTLARGWGDCDCSATLLQALFSALGYRSAVVGLTIAGVPRHAVAAVEVDRVWMWADGSEPGGLRPWGRHPMAHDDRRGARGIVSPTVVRVPMWP